MPTLSSATWTLSREVRERDGADRVRDLWVSRTVGESQPGAHHSTWSYNDFGQLSGQGGFGMTTALAYGYDADTGRRTSSTGVLVLGSAIDEKDRYWGEGRVRKAGDPQVSADGTYTYNRHGDMKTATLGSDTRTFSYNAKHRLRWTQVGEGDRIYYQWDTANDRRTGMGVGTLAGDEWQAPATFKTTYDYDDSGALTLWDDKTDASHEDQAAYLYDGEGQRYRTVLTEGHDLPLAEQTVTTTDYLYDGLKLVSLRVTKKTGTGTLLGAWQLLYFYDAQGRAYAGIDRKLDSAAGTTHSFYLFTNDRGDVLQLQDADHVAFAAYRYDAYGRPTEASSQGNDGAMPAEWAEAIAQRNVLRYASYVYDTHSGLYYLQRRHYDPITRQFLSRDPLRSDGDESPYQYCAGDPVAATDPWGLYVTASGERDDPQIYIPQTGYVVAKGVGTGHHGALGGDTSDLYLPWQGSLGSLSTPGLADRALQGTGQFLRTGLELAAFLCGDPWAHPFGDDPNAEMGASAALMFVDPFAGTSGALRSGAGLIDDVARGVGAGARGIGSLSRAGEFGIMSYREMRVAKAGTGLQAHHLIESRFKDVVREKAGDMLSIAVTPAEHQKFTNAWRSEIAYGTDYKSVSPERVEAAARKVYGQYPDILSALGL